MKLQLSLIAKAQQFFCCANDVMIIITGTYSGYILYREHCLIENKADQIDQATSNLINYTQDSIY